MREAFGLLHLARLRAQPSRAGLTVATIAAGVTLVVAVLISQMSVVSALDSFADQRAGPAAFEIQGGSQPAGVDEAVVRRVTAVDGVRTAVPLVHAVTLAETAAGNEILIVALGVDCRIEAIVGDIGCGTTGLDDSSTAASSDGPESSPQGPVLAPRLHRDLGDNGVVRTDRGRISTKDASTIELLDEFNRGRVALFPLAASQALFGREDAYDSVLVVPDPMVDASELRERLATAVGEHNTVQPAGDSSRRGNPQEPMMILIALLALVLGAHLAHSVVMLSLEERRRDLAIAASLGASQRTLMTGTMIEAGLLGLGGGLVGAAGGVLVARPITASLASFGTRFTGVHVDVSVSPLPVAVGVALGVVVALVAAVRPVWRVTHADVSAELQARGMRAVEAASRSSHRVAGFAGLGLAGLVATWVGQRGGGLESWQLPTALAGLAAAAFFLVGATFHAASPVLRMLAPPVRGIRRSEADLALDNLIGQPRRTGTITLLVAAAVAMSMILGNIERSLPTAAATEIHKLERGTVRVTTLPTLNIGALAARPSPDSRARLAAVPGVRDVINNYGIMLQHPSLESGPVGVTTREPIFLSRLPVLTGDPVEEVIERGDVLIGPGLARDLDLRPGDTFDVPGRYDMASLRVGAVWADGDFEGRNLAVGYDQFEDIWGQHVPRHVHVTPQPGTSPDELADRIHSQLRGIDPDLRALTPDALAHDLAAEVHTHITPFWALQRSLMPIAVVATTLTLLLVGVQRRREYGTLTALGITPTHLGRMIPVEAGLIAVTGTLLGTLVGIAVTVGLWFTIPLIAGWGIPFTLNLTTPATYALLTTASVLLGSALPAWRATRLDPAAVLRTE
jgi:putative ABC transport system permease protein